MWTHAAYDPGRIRLIRSRSGSISWWGRRPALHGAGTVFCPDPDYLRPFKHIVATTILKGTVPGFQPDDGIVLAEPGRSLWMFPLTDYLSTVMFSYRTNDENAQFRRPPVE